MMYSLDEIGLIPATVSDIKSRKDVNPFIVDEVTQKEKLPVFVSPMTCIVDADNISNYYKHNFIPIVPVTPENFWLRKCPTDSKNGYWNGWAACTLDEFKSTFLDTCYPLKDKYYILLDVANGHMKQLFDLVKQAKETYGNSMKIMIGNIANPETYIDCCLAGVDYVRVGIGGGSGCTTSVQTGIHASMPWILEGIKKLKDKGVPFIDTFSHNRVKMPFKNFLNITKGIETKIIADGGITTISRAIKCLALGADYVMMGKVFAECTDVEIEQIKCAVYPKNHYYGQSSRDGQMDRFGMVKSNPEGTDLWVDCTTNLEEFSTKFEAALRSAMSYAGARTLDEFIGQVKYEYMSPDEYRAYNK